MKIAVALIFLSALAGCSEPKEIVPTIAPQPLKTEAGRPLTDKEKVGLLRAEAHKRHLHWKVFCSERDEPNMAFLGTAKQQGHSDSPYIEDGAKPWWAEWGSSQADAAYSLYISIQQSPNMTTIYHRPDYRPNGHKKMCPPELRGE